MDEKIDKNTAIQIARNFFSPPLTQDAAVLYEHEANDITYWRILFAFPAPAGRKFPEFDYLLVQVNTDTGEAKQMPWEW